MDLFEELKVTKPIISKKQTIINKAEKIIRLSSKLNIKLKFLQNDTN